MKVYSWIVLLSVIALVQCKDQYTTDIDLWRKDRENSLQKADGWLTLIGLHWIDADSVSLGSAPHNTIQFPDKAPNEIGHMVLKNNRWFMNFEEHMEVYVKGHKARSTDLNIAEDDDPVPISWGSLVWYVIKRGDRYALRMKDSLAEPRTQFVGLDYFDADPNWKLEGTIIYNDPVKDVSIVNVFGDTSVVKSPAILEFSKDDQVYSLDLLDGGYGKYFVIFADATNGNETYDGGRYMYIKKPQNTTQVALDFNKAYNPPCVFTPYATCPIPPEQNRLPIAVMAGEKRYGKAGSH